MSIYSHTCHFCGRSELVVAESSVALPEKWRWLTMRKQGKDAGPVCNECWIERVLEFISGRGSSEIVFGGRVKRCCK